MKCRNDLWFIIINYVVVSHAWCSMMTIVESINYVLLLALTHSALLLRILYLPISNVIMQLEIAFCSFYISIWENISKIQSRHDLFATTGSAEKNPKKSKTNSTNAGSSKLNYSLLNGYGNQSRIIIDK